MNFKEIYECSVALHGDLRIYRVLSSKHIKKYWYKLISVSSKLWEWIADSVKRFATRCPERWSSRTRVGRGETFCVTHPDRPCLNEKFGTQKFKKKSVIFHNECSKIPTANLRALNNSCEKIECWWSELIFLYIFMLTAASKIRASDSSCVSTFLV